MAEPDPAPSPTCAHCEKVAKHHCSGCRESADFLQVVKTSYCSAECQKAHWESHKAHCKRLRYTKNLYQAGDIINTLWPIIRSQTKQSTIDKIYFDGERVDFWETVQYDDYRYLEPLEDFHSDKNVVRVILDMFNLSDSEAIYGVHHILQKLLAGICSKIEILEVKAKNLKWLVTGYQRSGPEDGYCETGILEADILRDNHSSVFRLGDEEVGSHYIFRVRLKGGREHFAIDITNARHGRFDTVIPWNQYVTERVSRMNPVTGPVGFSQHGKPQQEFLIREIDLSQFCTFRMKYLLETWMHEQGLTYDTIVTLSQSEFTQKLAGLQAYAKEGMRSSFRDSTKCGDLVMQMQQLDESSSTRDELQRERIALMERTGVLQAAEGISTPFLFEVACTPEQSSEEQS